MDVIRSSEHTVFVQTSNIYYKKWEVENPQNTIILLHDSLGCTALWREWGEEFAKVLNFNVISYDRRGYGKSDNYTVKRPIDYLEQEAEILNDLLAHWQVEKPILFGFSDGASVATIYAGMFPEKINGLIIEGVHVLIEEVTLQGVREAQKTLETTNISKALAKYHGDKVFDLYYAWTKTWLSDEHQSWNIEHFIPKIQVPILIIQGELDEFGTMNQVNAFDKAMAKVEKLIVPKAGHTAHKDAKPLVFDTIVKFVKTL
ncbi:Pimeloyl-ACP methyl ester carboxylesterase [Paenimyroides aquimaris]|uniref:Pimeloyl-ACP methyl ester carboxylesterase n=1 Tax=Paenimyroides marinum TaxID=1159016 RepID=A0A1H6KYU4_9FLAO|nr:alpha/beta hydrolase [Paenimyroides aquimaris]SEH76991.1 Pimeloyl-ACP methyl ester carboxylesterase [Paenimyroides aquimaris]